jgi:hypothetical protein
VPLNEEKEEERRKVRQKPLDSFPSPVKISSM